MPPPFLPRPTTTRPWWAPSASPFGDDLAPTVPFVFLPNLDQDDEALAELEDPQPGDGRRTDARRETILLSGSLDDERAGALAASLLGGRRRRTPVRLVLNSDGGDLVAGLAAVDALVTRGDDVDVTVLGHAGGTAGALAVLAGGARRMGPSATLDLALAPHDPQRDQPPGFVGATAEELARRAELRSAQVDDLAHRIATRCHLDVDVVAALLTDRTRRPAPEAVALGLVDQILD